MVKIIMMKKDMECKLLYSVWYIIYREEKKNLEYTV